VYQVYPFIGQAIDANDAAHEMQMRANGFLLEVQGTMSNEALRIETVTSQTMVGQESDDTIYYTCTTTVHLRVPNSLSVAVRKVAAQYQDCRWAPRDDPRYRTRHDQEWERDDCADIGNTRNAPT